MYLNQIITLRMPPVLQELNIKGQQLVYNALKNFTHEDSYLLYSLIHVHIPASAVNPSRLFQECNYSAHKGILCLCLGSPDLSHTEQYRCGEYCRYLDLNLRSTVRSNNSKSLLQHGREQMRTRTVVISLAELICCGVFALRQCVKKVQVHSFLIYIIGSK